MLEDCILRERENTHVDILACNGKYIKKFKKSAQLKQKRIINKNKVYTGGLSQQLRPRRALVGTGVQFPAFQTDRAQTPITPFPEDPAPCSGF